jgi:SAM-dependent methyltransferase
LAAAEDDGVRREAPEVRVSTRDTLVRSVKAAMAEPRTRGLSIDDPRTTVLRRSVIEEKPFLRRIYEEWYAAIAADVPAGDGAVVEIGSGAGFLDRYLPGLVTSETFRCPNVRIVFDCQSLPFADGSLRGMVMTDVFHHVPDVRRLLREAARCVRSGGVVAMIEPWVTAWSRVVYGRLHHEPFETGEQAWEFPRGGPLSAANGALPWIVFERDIAIFEKEFPEWTLKDKRLLMPFRYLLSGGMSHRALMPASSFELWRAIENLLSPAMGRLAMFAHIVLERT